MSTSVLAPPSRTHTTFSVNLRWPGAAVSCQALIDSGAEASFVDVSWALDQGIPLIYLKEATSVYALDGVEEGV